MGERPIPQLVVGIVLERNGRPRRVQTERPLSGRAHGGFVAKERPLAARRREVLLPQPAAQIVAVCDAVAVGEDPGWTRIGCTTLSAMARTQSGLEPATTAAR